ncbi:MAG: ferrous iron transport protein A [Patescibacteria group bacterium]
MKQSLIKFQKGDKVKIKCVKCGQGLKNRLCDLGLFDGSEVEITKNDKYGPLIIKILDSKIALGRGEANKIYGEKQ